MTVEPIKTAGTPLEPFRPGDCVYVARAAPHQQCIYTGSRVGTVYRVLRDGWYDVLLHGMCRTYYQHDQLELVPHPPQEYPMPDTMPDNRVSDAPLVYLPLTSGDSPRHNNIELLMCGEPVPRIRVLEIGDLEVRLVTLPCAFAQRYRTMLAESVKAPLEYSNRKHRWSCKAAVTYYAERMTWPGAVCEVVTHLALSESWVREVL